jgi:Xaa-Pro aminopeptidase
MNQEIFAQRRNELMSRLGDGMAVLFSAPHAKRNDDVHHEYRTCSYFYYLTGLREQESAMILAPKSDKPFRLFVMPKNPEMEMWEGKRIGVEGAKAHFRADETYPIADFEKVFREQLKQSGTLYHLLGSFAEHDDLVFRVLKDHHPNPRRGEKKFERLVKLQELVAPMRKVKTAAELELIRRNCRNSGIAHRKAMEFTRPGQFEYQVEAEIEFWFRHGGAEDLAYSSIVAGGNNATILHYKTNRDPLQDGSLLLIDAGGEMDLYASDITRTFPVNGKFTKAQRELYEIVLRSNKEAIAAVKPGVRFHDVHKRALEVLVDGLMGLGLLRGKREEILADRKQYVGFYPHNTSHWIGLDVHDCGDYFLPDGSSIPLEIGNLLTIEPGIYIGEDREDVPSEYRGIGIRIEDDVLVTPEGAEVLTDAAPKEVADIESIVGTGAARQ